MDHSTLQAIQKAQTYIRTARTTLTLAEKATILLMSNAAAENNSLPFAKKFADEVKSHLKGKGAKKETLHDFCLSFAAVYTYDKKQIDGKYFATLAQRLIKAEYAPGGPYYNDATLDLETNCLIAYLFHLFGKPLPAVQTFILSHKDLGRRATLSPLTAYITTTLRLLPQAAPKTPLSAILFSITPGGSLNQQDKDLLLTSQQSNGSWRDSSRLSPLAVTLIVSTVLSHHQVPASLLAHNKRYRRLLNEATDDLQTLPADLRGLALTLLDDIRRLDKTHEIVLISYFFADHFPHLKPTLAATLAHANIYCWVAYILYDRLLDGDKTPPESLPLLAFAMRRSHQLYRQAVSLPTAQKLVDEAFTTMDITNAWEVRHARFTKQGRAIEIKKLPSYRSHLPLANRSLGHILGPLLLSLELSATRSQFQALQQGLHHFLIARQLQDDIHDWTQDIQNGQASAVVVHLLRRLGIQPGLHDTDQLIAAMQQEFWQRSLGEITTLIARHTAKSKKAFLKSNLVENSSGLIALVESLHAATLKIAEEQRKYRSFLSEFSADKPVL
jgi:hypothetical protein